MVLAFANSCARVLSVRSKILTALVMANLLFTASQTQAQSIGIDWYGGNGTGDQTQMVSTDIAGVIPQGNWNSFLDDPAVATETFPLLLSDGTASGATVAFTGSPNDWDTNVDQNASANHKMMLGYIDTNDTSTTTVRISGLPASLTSQGYNVILYYDGDNGTGGTGQHRVARYEINGVSQWGRDAGDRFGGTFVQGQTLIDPAPGMSGAALDNQAAAVALVPAGNYMVFSGLTAPDFTLNVQASVSAGTTNRASLNGMQIVAIPEPSSIALISIGAVGALVALTRRARRQGR